MPTIMPNVRRSRLSWMNSLPTMRCQRVVRVAHQVNEHVLETRLDFTPFTPGFFHRRGERGLERLSIRPGDVERVAECGDLLDCRSEAQSLGQRRQIGT